MSASRPARSLRCRVAAWIYAGMAIPSLVLGAIYLFRPTFMPYHAVALGKEWAELDAATQVLIKALMEVAGGGWLALGTLTLLLVAFPIRRGERWARWAVPIASLILYVPTLLYVPRLIAEPVVLRPRSDVRCGPGTVSLKSSPYDPLGEVPVGELVVCAYGRFDNSMLPGKVVGRAWWLAGFLKHAFFKADVAPVKLGWVEL